MGWDAAAVASSPSSWVCSARPFPPKPISAPLSFTSKRAWSRLSIPTSSFCCFSAEQSSADATAPQKTDKGSFFYQPNFTRRWIEEDVAALSPSLSSERFLVMSYNILGDDNASNHHDLYPHIPSHFMNWDRRKRLICQELNGRSPHIVCLQEVDRYDDILSNMKKEGYIGSFKRRTGGVVDGCAMLWKESTVHLLEGKSIEFRQFGLRDNVAQLFVFEADD